ncbi:hypothetical protein CRYUN_Cryun18bG0109600 [Craigia yunnanensis]
MTFEAKLPCQELHDIGSQSMQIVRLQETPDEIPEGGTPHTVSLLMHDKLVDAGKPRDRVEGYECQSWTDTTVKSLFKTYIDCLHIKKSDKSRMKAEDPIEVDKGSQRIEDDVRFDEDKLFAINLPSGASFRGGINILLVGDPGTSKSQLLQYIQKLAPRGIYTSVGDLGALLFWKVEPLFLSDRSICCNDEFYKMSDNSRSMLHEEMEQQTVSIAKAGIIASLNARTSVLACVNPSGSRYNPRLSVIDNIHLPPTLLSRFDLIYLVLDKADEQTDRRLAKHIVSLHFEDTEVITATARQIESLIRLSEALVRIRFSEWVELRDVTETFRLLEVAMQQSATEHSTGTIDMDLITTGVSASERMRRENVLSATRNIIMEKIQLGGPSLLDELKKQSSGSEIHLHDLRNAVATLASEGFVVLHGDRVKRI